MSLQAESEHRIPSLDGLRAFSVAFVFLGHAVGTLKEFLPQAALNLLVFADLGVRIFFVISGFLISQILFAELEREGQISLPKFYFRRALRLLPTYYSFLVVMLLASAAGWLALTPQDRLHASTFTQNYCSGCTWNLGHTWSLSVEEQFYLLWPLAIFLLRRRAALVAAAALVILCPLGRVFVLATGADVSFYRFELAADSIATGCLLAGLYSHRLAPARPDDRADTRLLWLIPGAVVITVLFSNRPSVIAPSIYWGIVVPLQNLLIAALILRLLQWHSRQHIVTRVLNSRPLVQIGLMSYSIYLWQQPFFNPYSGAWYTRFPANLLLTASCATLSYYLLERTSLRVRAQLGRRIFKRRSTPAPIRPIP